VTPIYGHTSEATAYEVADYPYGYNLRCKIRYWIEFKPKHGFRFVSQTLNPKNGRWNKPKPSIYIEFGMAMYLDAENHVQFRGIGQYSSAEDILAFIKDFPGTDFSVLTKVIPAKIKYAQMRLEGKAFITINGQRVPDSEAELTRFKAEIALLEEAKAVLS